MNRNFLPAISIFFGSMLLFGVQPMVGRTLLPFFGGTSAVWIVCLCAFQVLLLGGYAYAHGICARRSVTAHLALLGVSAAWAFAVASFRGGLGGALASLPPALGVMVFLLAIAGLPYLALSANASLVQSVAAKGGRDVYHLYAVSNVGSLVGLFLYPFVLEPYVAVGDQWRIFGIGIAVYALLLWRLAGRASNALEIASSPQAVPRNDGEKKLSAVFWVLLPAVSCGLLNAVTAHLTLDVIALQLLWCVLLALFLLSYVIGFSGVCARFLKVWDALAICSLAVLAYASGLVGGSGAFHLELPAGCGVVLFGGAALHVRLYEVRPASGGLTRYYLYGAIGGAVGGVLTGLVAPLVFTRVWEYPCALAALMVSVALMRDWRRWLREALFALGALAVLAWFVVQSGGVRDPAQERLVSARGFFGTVGVESVKLKSGESVGELHRYVHGATLHCDQILLDGYGVRPSLYYTPHAGGLPILGHHKYASGKPMRVGIVGMGMGVSCAYGRVGDVYRCWEISPEAMNVATNPAYFTYVSGSKAKVEVVLGDGRLELERERREGAPKYDVLQIDAFSGDSVPYHLSTKEAFALYLDRLAPGGMLSVHITNWHIDLAPLVKSVACEFNLNAILYTPDASTGETLCAWALLVREVPEGFALPSGVNLVDLNKIRDFRLPSDEKGSLLGLLYYERAR